jgi:hypothetical protein
MKRLGQITLIILLFILLLISIVVLQDADPQQKIPNNSPYSFNDTLINQTYNLDSLRAIIGNNKGLPKGFELAAAIAYSAYPEL